MIRAQIKFNYNVVLLKKFLLLKRVLSLGAERLEMFGGFCSFRISMYQLTGRTAALHTAW